MARIQDYAAGIVSGDDKIIGNDGGNTRTFSVNDLAQYINDNYQIVGGITLGSFSLVTNPAAGEGSLTYNASNGVFTFTPANTFSGDYNDLSNKPFIFGGDYEQLSNKPTIPTYLTDLQIAQGSAGQYLQSNGDGTFQFAPVVGDGVGIEFGDLSVTTNAANSGGSLTYNALNGTFTFEPADIPTVPTDINQLADSTGVIPTDIQQLTDNTSIIPNTLTDLQIVDGNNGEVLKTDGNGSFTFGTISAGTPEVTFAVTVSNPGSGNKYYIDGGLQEQVQLVSGIIYKFDQSDSSNSGHPLVFSETYDGTHGGGSAYTTGVTTNGIAGQAGAYTQIVLEADAPTLYYYCSSHSGMGYNVAGKHPNKLVATNWINSNSNNTSVIETEGHMIPPVNATYDLGEAQLKYRDLYLSSASDIKLKENIVDFEGGLNFINQINVKTFDWKDGTKPTETGFIAQNIKEALDNSNYKSERLWEDNGERQGLDKNQLIPALVAAINELSNKVIELENKITNV